jgi:hypothetical protein
MNFFHVVPPISYNELRCTASPEFTFLLFVTWLQQLRTKRATQCHHSFLSLRANDFMTPETHSQHARDFIKRIYCNIIKSKVRCPATGRGGHRVPGRLRPRINSTFGTTRMVRRQPYAPAAFSHFQRLSRPQGTWFCRKESRKKSPVTPPGIDPGTVRLVALPQAHIVTSLTYIIPTVNSES